MINLSLLLEKFSQALDRESRHREIIEKVIKDKTGIALESGAVFKKDGVVEINATPAVKNEIALREQEIRAELKSVYRLTVTRIVYK